MVLLQRVYVRQSNNEHLSKQISSNTIEVYKYIAYQYVYRMHVPNTTAATMMASTSQLPTHAR